MRTKSPKCWASDQNARAVKVELSAERSLVLPFDQFAFAELKSGGKEQQFVSADGQNQPRRVE